MNTIVQLREVCGLINTANVRPKLQYVLSTWILRRPPTASKQIRLLHPMIKRSVTFIAAMWNRRKIEYYSTLYVANVRITTARFSQNRKTDDSSILININGIDQFGIVKEIFSVEDEDSFVHVCCLSNATPFTCSTNSVTFSFNQIQHGSIGNNLFVSTSRIVEKCVRVEYPPSSTVKFIRFPNLSMDS